jgi:hypothetical protein
MEMMATLLDRREELQELRKDNSIDTSFQANLEEVQVWYRGIIEPGLEVKWGRGINLRWPLIGTIPMMVLEDRSSRVSSDHLKGVTADMRCPRCCDGPEPFEAAETEW